MPVRANDLTGVEGGVGHDVTMREVLHNLIDNYMMKN